MLWRVRTTLLDRPGSLALLASTCGQAGVNILAVQVFPGVDAVTDELVLSSPDDWTEADVVGLVGGAGGRSVTVVACTEAALTDQPTRYVQAARTVLAQPASFPEVVARLFDAETAAETAGVAALDVMEMAVGDVQIQVRRRARFTATEHARGAAMADLVSDVLARARESASGHGPPVAPEGAAPPAYVVAGESVSAVVDGAVVGVAALRPEAEEVGVRLLSLRVEEGWRRRGIGTRLLLEAARLAADLGAEAIVLTARADSQAVLPMVLAAGLRGRIRMAADTLSVRIPVRRITRRQAELAG